MGCCINIYIQEATLKATLLAIKAKDRSNDRSDFISPPLHRRTPELKQITTSGSFTTPSGANPFAVMRLFVRDEHSHAAHTFKHLHMKSLKKTSNFGVDSVIRSPPRRAFSPPWSLMSLS